VIHAFTVDVEDLYNLMLRQELGRESPPTHAVVRNTRVLANLLAQFEVRGTFFVLGEVAETFPSLVRELAAAGHELGVHGYSHRKVWQLGPEAFRREVRQAKARVEDAAGQEAAGHRAPAFSLRADTHWLFDVLAEEGFRYDSSVRPSDAGRFGWTEFGEDIVPVGLGGGRTLIEAPMPMLHVFGKALPACGGGYLRHLPFWYTRWAMRQIGRRRPVIVYVHPYEVDTTPPPAEYAAVLAKAPRALRRVHRKMRRNAHTVLGKLRRLLERHWFAPLQEVIERQLGERAAAGPT